MLPPGTCIPAQPARIEPGPGTTTSAAEKYPTKFVTGIGVPKSTYAVLPVGAHCSWTCVVDETGPLGRNLSCPNRLTIGWFVTGSCLDTPARNGNSYALSAGLGPPPAVSSPDW